MILLRGKKATSKVPDSDVIRKYFPGLDDRQIKKLELFAARLTDWNSKINLVSRADTGELFVRHILHSLSITRIVEFSHGTRILDVGTGGGFPGIPLAIFYPGVRFLLIDSIGKKIMAVNDMIRELDLKNTEALKVRAEEINGKFDFIVSRAVTRLLELYRLTAKNITPGGSNAIPNGIICLKGGDLTAELKDLARRAEIFEIERFFNESFFTSKKIVFIPRH